MPDNLDEIRSRLSAFFYANDLEWKVQTFNNKKRDEATKAMVVPYISARAIMDRLDEVVGIGNWQDEYDKAPEGGILCKLSLKLNGEWVTKMDGAENSDIEAVKGGISNSFKRAAVKWGIGRYLYEVPRRWFDLDDRKYPVYKDDNGRKLDAPVMLRQFLPDDATASGAKPPAQKVTSPTLAKAAKEQAPAPKPEPVVNKQPAPTVPSQPAPTPAPNHPAEIADLPLADPGIVSPGHFVEAAPSNGNGHTIEWAQKQIVPDGKGVVMAGKTLGDAARDVAIGPFVISFLSGRYKNLSGQIFEPQTDAEKELKVAAELIYNSDPELYDAEKARRRAAATNKAAKKS